MSMTIAETIPAAPSASAGDVSVYPCVDDDPNVLRAVARDLRKKYTGSLPHHDGQLPGDRARVGARVDGPTRFGGALPGGSGMPGMSGVELLEQARDAWPDSKRVLLTAYADIDASIQPSTRLVSTII